jgi:DNA-binding GntR family transcriptional regulator
MRNPKLDEIINAKPFDLREHTKTTQTYLLLRKKILKGEYQANQLITPKEIDIDYKVTGPTAQMILLRLASEGLIKIQPIKERIGANNASINEYRVADFTQRHRIFSTRHGGFVSDIKPQNSGAYMETKILKVQYADAEIAALLHIPEGENVVFHRTHQYQDPDTLVAIADTYLPFWFVTVLPELEKPNTDIYQLMFELGKHPSWCTETVDVIQSTLLEREIFGLSSDDFSSLLKILRCTFDDEGTPMSVDFLTDRGDTYRLHYSFPLFVDGIPEAVRSR